MWMTRCTLPVEIPIVVDDGRSVVLPEEVLLNEDEENPSMYSPPTAIAFVKYQSKPARTPIPNAVPDDLDSTVDPLSVIWLSPLPLANDICAPKYGEDCSESHIIGEIPFPACPKDNEIRYGSLALRDMESCKFQP